MRVVYIADIGIEGGATRSLVELVSNMKEKFNVDVIVFTSRRNQLNSLLDERSIENYSLGYGAFLQGAPDAWWKRPIKWLLFAFIYYSKYRSSLKRALSIVDWKKVDLIHTNVARDDIGMRLSRITGIPNICHIREFAELDFNCWSYRPHYVKFLNQNTDRFIAISKSVGSYWVEKGISSEKIQVIYNGVDNKQIRTKSYDDFLTRKELRLVIVGGVIPNKGQWQAIEALCRLPAQLRENVTLDVIGGISENYRTHLLEPLKKAGLVDNVHFCGKCSDVYDRLCDYDIGLMCSLAEGFGRVTVEYMHAGLAVIASNTGANPELIIDGENGILYERNSTQSLADKIQWAYSHRKQLMDIAASGQNKARECFTSEHNAKDIFNAYQQIMEMK